MVRSNKPFEADLRKQASPAGSMETLVCAYMIIFNKQYRLINKRRSAFVCYSSAVFAIIPGIFALIDIDTVSFFFFCMCATIFIGIAQSPKILIEPFSLSKHE